VGGEPTTENPRLLKVYLLSQTSSLVDILRTMTTRDERFWSKVKKTKGCWLWTASTRNGGYGQFWIPPRVQVAHRVAYEWLVGPIPDGTELDHLCRTPACVNPDHLEPVPHRINILRGEGPSAKHAVKTRCPAGHIYDEKNTYEWRGMRRCRLCNAAQARRRRLLP
jgi:hypothetical protein